MYYKFSMFQEREARDSIGNGYFDDTTIRRIKLTPCSSPEECFTDYGTWGVYRSWDNSDRPYNCKDENEAYDYLLEAENNAMYECRHDL